MLVQLNPNPKLYVLNTDREKTKCPPKSVDQIVASSFQILKHNVFRASKKRTIMSQLFC